MPSRGSTAEATRAVRAPRWLSQGQRADLATAINAALDRQAASENQNDHLRAVLTELSVASARERLWPTSAALVRRVNGYTADVLPIRISEDELSAVLSLPDLSVSVRGCLP